MEVYFLKEEEQVAKADSLIQEEEKNGEALPPLRTCESLPPK